MEILNVSVRHKVFGRGVVTAQTDGSIMVRFAAKECKFIFPDAFAGHIRCEDEQLQAELEEMCRVKREAEAEAVREMRIARAKAEAELAKIADENRNGRRNAHDRHATENNLAFKCNFCDGGCSDACIGFKGVCSDEVIKYNIEKKHRAWCSDEKDSNCYKYYKGQIDRAELERIHRSGFVCYESRMLTEWKAEAGEDRNGVDGPKARRISNVSRDCLAVLTTELPDLDGKERVIFGAFITGVVDEGDALQAGYVKANGNYHVELTPAEARRMRFWHYHRNRKSSDVVQWGTGLYRYMDDTVCARILLDIIEIKSDPAEKAHVRNMLNYYCSVKGLDVNNIPDANGAI